MQNTHQEYLSTERAPTVLDELATLLPPLSEEQRTALEADILRNGCYSPIIVDESLHIIDGHHRQQICQAHDIPYRMAVFAFDSLLEAKQWMVSTQRSRRNLQPWELGKIALRLKPEIEGRARERQGVRTDLLTTVSEGSAPVSTRRELADAVGLGEVTMGKVMQIDQHAPTAVREALDRDELSVSQGYRLTKQLQALPEAEREDAGRQAVELERARREIRRGDAETDRRTAVSRRFTKALALAGQLEPTKEQVRCWVSCTRMTRQELESAAEEAEDAAQTFLAVAGIIREKFLPTDRREQDAV